jgi:hypothetical protein
MQQTHERVILHLLEQCRERLETKDHRGMLAQQVGRKRFARILIAGTCTNSNLFLHVPGPAGAPGFDGARGNRGDMGAGCDGVVPTDGSPPLVIDACGVCGGDESECANGRASRTAHAVGDPHYLTYDGISFDYQACRSLSFSFWSSL